MSYLLIYEYLNNSIINFFKNIFVKSKYLVKIFLKTSSIFNNVICAFLANLIINFDFSLNKTTCIKKILILLLGISLACSDFVNNFHLLSN